MGIAQEGFEPLFNGRNLDGWSTGPGGAGIWRVDDGVVVASALNDHRKQTFLLSERDYSNFILRFEFQLPRNSDSGVVVRAVPGENHIEVNLRNFDDPPGMHAVTAALRWSTSGRGADYLPPDRPAKLKADGSWNAMEIEASGRYLRVSVNDQEVRSRDLGYLADLPNALPGLKRSSGRIGFQSHTGTVRFRNIMIKELAPARGSTDRKPAKRLS